MTVQNPPVFLQNGTHPAEDVRRMFYHLIGQKPGIIGTDSMEVTEKSGTANMSVDVSEGAAFVRGSISTYAGAYFVENRGTTNLTISASDPTNDRKDLIVAVVKDSAYSGGDDEWALEVVTGTPSASPAQPGYDHNTILLAEILVQANVTSITDSDITDLRHRNSDAGFVAAVGGIIPVRDEVYRPSPGDVPVGTVIYEQENNLYRKWDGSEWIMLSNPVLQRQAKISLGASDQSIPNNSYTQINCDSTVRIPGGWTKSAGAITVPEDGLYLVECSVLWAGNATGNRITAIYSEGSLAGDSVRHNAIQAAPNGANFCQKTMGTIYVEGGSAIEMYVSQTSGSSLDVLETQDYTHMTITRVV